jgi:radical SAM superfamily enzyme
MKKFKITSSGKKTKSNDGCGFCPNVTFTDNEFKDNKALDDQGKDKGTIFVTAQLNLDMSWSLT